MNPYTTCHACGGTISERADDLALTHCSEARVIMFFHDTEQCRAIAKAMRKARGENEWSLTARAYQWDPVEAEWLIS